MREFLIGERDKRTKELRELVRRVEILNAELDLLKVVIAKCDEGTSPEQSHMPARQQHGISSKGTRLSPRWMPVLKAAVQQFPNAIEFEEVPDIQRGAGQLPSDTNNIRSHVWTQSNAGMYEKQGSGSFRATEKAAEAIGLPLGASNSHDEVTADSGAPKADELFAA